MFVQTEPTPNPATLKFLPGKEVMKDGTMFYQNQESASNSPLAMNLFNIKGVEGVFFGSDFITITKGKDNDWTLMKPAILGCIIEHFTMNKPIISEQSASTGHTIDENDSDVVKKIKELLDSKVRPAVAMDGGDIIFDKYNEGIVFLQMQGAPCICRNTIPSLYLSNMISPPSIATAGLTLLSRSSLIFFTTSLSFSSIVCPVDADCSEIIGLFIVKCSMIQPKIAGFISVQSLSLPLVIVIKSDPKKTPSTPLILNKFIAKGEFEADSWF